jgi:hypothetical protein
MYQTAHSVRLACYQLQGVVSGYLVPSAHLSAHRFPLSVSSERSNGSRRSGSKIMGGPMAHSQTVQDRKIWSDPRPKSG